MARKIAVEILGDASSLERAFKRSSTSAKHFHRDISQAGRGAIAGAGLFRGMGRAVAFASGAFLGTAGLTSAVRASFEEMAQSAKVTAQTNAVLKSTGGVANVTAKQIDALAASLLAKSGVDDETIKSGENMLLTFTSIRNEVGKGNDIFTQASKAILDMDTAMTHGNVTQESLSKTAIQVGKALQDPIHGVASLRRVGVALTEQQQKQVKAFVASGRTIDAQKLILRELNREFGGSAKAMGQTLPGKINILRETLRNLGGSLARQLVPAITRLVNRLNVWLGSTKHQQQIQRQFRQIVQAVSSVLRTMAAILSRVNRITGGLGNTIKALIGVFVVFKALKMAAAVAGIARSFGLLGGRARGSATAIRRARLASIGFNASLVGKAGLVVGVGLAAFALTTLILKVTGLDKKLKQAGAHAFDLAANIGLVNDPMKQFEGKTTPDQRNTRFIRNRLARLEAGGLTPRQAADQFLRTHPNLARHDVEVLAGVYGTPPVQVTATTHVNLDGQRVASNTTKHQQRANKRRSAARRGPYAGPH